MTPPEIEPATFRFVAQHLNHCVTAVPNTNVFNRLKPNDLYISRTAPLTSKFCILYIYSTNVGTEYFEHALYSPFFSLQNAVCFIMLTCLVPVLFTFFIQGVLKLKKRNNSGAKGLIQETCVIVCTYKDTGRVLSSSRYSLP